MKERKNKKRFFVILSLAVFIVACGIKSNPVPSMSMIDYRPMISEIQAEPTDNAVVLKWKLDDKKGVIKNIFIERSEQGTAGNECADCPRKYERVGQLKVNQSLPSRGKDQAKEQSFVDEKVEKERTYDYRLVVCDDKDICQERYGVQINFK